MREDPRGKAMEGKGGWGESVSPGGSRMAAHGEK
jgi:hypothetical protein